MSFGHIRPCHRRIMPLPGRVSMFKHEYLITPIEIENAAQSGELVIFVGAGISRLVKCPTWDGFADKILEQLVPDGIDYYELSAPENEEYAVKFIELIRTITLHAKAENYSNHRTWWQLAKIIRNIPVHLIKVKDIELIDYWLDDPYGSGLVAEEVGEKWLPDLLERPDAHCHKIALCLLDCLYKVNFAEEKTGDYKRKEPLLRYDSYHAEKISKKNVTKLSGWKLGLPAVEIFQSRLVSILNESNNDSWSSIWRKAIEEHDQNGSLDDVDDLIVAAYRDCLSGFVDINSREGRMLASNLCHWAAFVAQMDATVENWLLKIAPYADKNHNAPDLLRSLADISDSQPLEAQKIWIKMLDIAILLSIASKLKL